MDVPDIFPGYFSKHNTKQWSKNQTELERVKLDSVKRYVKEEKQEEKLQK
jgi:hypothetical protein